MTRPSKSLERSRKVAGEGVGACGEGEEEVCDPLVEGGADFRMWTAARVYDQRRKTQDSGNLIPPTWKAMVGRTFVGFYSRPSGLWSYGK